MRSIRHRFRWVAGVAAVVGLGAAGAVAPVGSSGASDRAAKPRVTTLVDGQHSIQGFAQDGQWIVWADAGAPCHLQVKIRRVAGGPTGSLSVRRGPTCVAAGSYDGYQHRMALAGTRALWAVVRATSTRFEFAVRTSSLNEGEGELIQPAIEGGDKPFRPVPLAGDGDSLVYVDIHQIGEAGTGVGDGRIFRVGRWEEVIPGMSRTVAVAVSGPVLAAARVRFGGCACNGDPSWSRDGRRVLFRSYRHDRGVSDLYVIDANGTNEQRLGVEASGAWSPAGGSVLLHDAAGGRPAVIVVDLDRGERRVVARGPISFPTWSPDGSRLAFASHDGLYAALADGSGLRRIVATKRLTQLAWSPDATRLAFLHRVGSQERLEVIASDGRSRRIVGEGSSMSFEWAPTGEGIAYSPYTRDGRHPLRIVAADGSGTVELLDDAASVYRWSPDGTRIAFGRDSGRAGALYITAPDGSGRRRVAGGISADLSWSPDGRQLAFVMSEGIDEVVYASSADGSVVRRLGAFRDVFWTGLVWAPDSGRLAVNDAAGITIVALDGSVINRIEKAGGPAWSPDGQSLAYSVGELGIADADGAGRRVVTSTQPDPRSVRVDVRSLSTGAYLGRFPIDGQPLAVALSPLRVAVLVQRAAGKRIELHRLNGSLERRVAVPRATDSELSTAGRWVVFRTGRRIHLLDARTGRRRVLALARATPVGLSIEGRRVAWAEQTKPSRVRAILLPPAEGSA